VQNKPATALGEYRKVISSYPKSPAVDTALYGMADAFFRLHACTDAKGAIDALVKRKPSKALEDRAKQLSRAIKDAGKAYCTS
jgi:TolA-binding protein